MPEPLQDTILKNFARSGLKSFLHINLLLCLLFLFIHAKNLYPAENKSEYSAENLLGFTKHLIIRGEYYRARLELDRINSYYPQFLTAQTSHVTQLYLYYQAKKYEDIIAKTGTLNENDIIFRTDAYLEISDFAKAGDLVEKYNSSKKPDIYIYKRTLLSYLLLNNIEMANKLLIAKSYYTGLQDINFSDMIVFSQRRFNDMKTPWRSLLFGVVPGCGYISAGNKPTGFFAMIVVTAFSALTYLSFKTENKAFGIAFGSITAFFYGGSILGGYLEAKRYNKENMNGLKDYLIEQAELSKDREEIYKQYGLESVR